MVARRPPTLLFDLGGVLYEVDFDALRALLGTDLTDDELKARWLRSPAVRAFELGQASPSEFTAAMLAEWRLALTPEEFIAGFAAFAKRPYDGAEALLARLREHHRVCCLSNTNALHWRRFGSFLDHFDAAFSSHLLGVIKPDAAVFAEVMARLDVEPDGLWFFDDSRPNVEGAARLGIRAFLVRGLSEVERVLRVEGLIDGVGRAARARDARHR